MRDRFMQLPKQLYSIGLQVSLEGSFKNNESICGSSSINFIILSWAWDSVENCYSKTEKLFFKLFPTFKYPGATTRHYK